MSKNVTLTRIGTHYIKPIYKKIDEIKFEKYSKLFVSSQQIQLTFFSCSSVSFSANDA